MGSLYFIAVLICQSKMCFTIKINFLGSYRTEQAVVIFVLCSDWWVGLFQWSPWRRGWTCYKNWGNEKKGGSLKDGWGKQPLYPVEVLQKPYKHLILVNFPLINPSPNFRFILTYFLKKSTHHFFKNFQNPLTLNPLGIRCGYLLCRKQHPS